MLHTGGNTRRSLSSSYMGLCFFPINEESPGHGCLAATRL